MRIGLVCPYSLETPGGVQNHVLGLAGYLLGLGQEPAVLAPGELSADHAARFGLALRHFTSAGAALPVPYNGSIARVNFGPLSAARVRRWLRDGTFDLIHIHEPITPSISVLALWAAEAPVVATFHTATPRSRSMQLARSALRPAIEKIAAGIAVSDSARQVVIQHLGRDAVVIPNGFSQAEFFMKNMVTPGESAVGLPWRGGDHPRLSFLGRLNEPRKGLPVLLGAVDQLITAHPDLDIVIAGQGSVTLPPGCRAVGAISDLERADLMRTTDVFVAPHLARESFGIVLIEAMAAGASVVASDLPAFTDVLTAPGHPIGHTFAAGDSAALASTVSAVLAQDQSEQRRDAAAASARYDWTQVGAEILQVYQAARWAAEAS